MSRQLEIIGALEVLAGEGYDIEDLAEAAGLSISGDDDDTDDVGGAIEDLMVAAGYGFPDIIGARRGRKPTGRGLARRTPPARRPMLAPRAQQPGQRLAAAAALARNLGGHVFDQRGPTRSREFPLGFVSNGQIAPAGSQNVTNRPQVPFRVDRLVVPSDIAGSFTIDDLKVGKDSQFAASGSNPARVFAENAVGVSLKGDTAAISQDVVIATTNIGGGALTFRASVIGPAVE